jgi:subtilase family serine protease
MGHLVMNKRTRLAMRSPRRLAEWAAGVAAASLLAMPLAAAGASSASGHVTSPGVRAACPATAATYYHPGHALYAHCDALVRTGIRSDTPTGYGPTDFQSAYKLTAASKQRGKGQTVAIVDAYNDPDLASNLATYRAHYKLPACTKASGCLKIVNQNGKTSPLPAGNTDWATEESLDVDMVSAICPNCHIILVEASGQGALSGLGAAEDEAAKLAPVISNSWSISTDAPDSTYGKYFNHPGHAITFSGGDIGYGTRYPADSQYVTAVEGTSLTKAPGTARGWTETVWNDGGGEATGSGCSQYNTKPKWQKAASVKDTACAKRTQGDVAADADPNTGAAIYDTYGQNGWLQVGGDSEASPTVAAVYALAGNATKVVYGSYPYAHTGDLFDVTKGSNGTCTPPKADAYLCTARKGYDGPSGLGTPDGYKGF